MGEPRGLRGADDCLGLPGGACDFGRPVDSLDALVHLDVLLQLRGVRASDWSGERDELGAGPEGENMLKNTQLITVVSWLTYLIVYTFPMIGIHGKRAVVAIQIGYCCSDVISKCLVGLMIYQITIYKSQAEAKFGR